MTQELQATDNNHICSIARLNYTHIFYSCFQVKISFIKEGKGEWVFLLCFPLVLVALSFSYFKYHILLVVTVFATYCRCCYLKYWGWWYIGVYEKSQWNRGEQISKQRKFGNWFTNKTTFSSTTGPLNIYDNVYYWHSRQTADNDTASHTVTKKKKGSPLSVLWLNIGQYFFI